MNCDMTRRLVVDGDVVLKRCDQPRVQVYPSKVWGRIGLCHSCLGFVRQHENPSLRAQGEKVDLEKGEVGIRAPKAPLLLLHGVLIRDDSAVE